MNAAHVGGGSGPSSALELPYPYLLFLGDTTEPAYAKTAFAARDWAPERTSRMGLRYGHGFHGPAASFPERARVRGARGLVIGIANTGGDRRELGAASGRALEAGLDIVSGLHVKRLCVSAEGRRATLRSAVDRYTHSAAEHSLR
jgi:hypothetical protein